MAGYYRHIYLFIFIYVYISHTRREVQVYSAVQNDRREYPNTRIDRSVHLPRIWILAKYICYIYDSSINYF